MSMSCFFTLSLLFLFIHTLPFNAQGVVPSSQTFNYVNEGEFGDYIVEYDANYRVLPIATSPFQVCFYNTTPSAYTLALRMGTVRSESLMRWVWEANRGNPVGENATFSLGTNGNLVLADANGRVAWQSNTANKGVVGFKLLPNGNMVLHDSKGSFVWQSFDSPTDTILVGQSFRLRGPNKLVSRLSEKENKNGPYSLALKPNRFAMYYTSKNSPKPMLYFDSTDYLMLGKQTLDNLTFRSQPETDDAFAYELILGYPEGGYRILSRPKYNSTLTYLRLGIDGGLRAFTFYARVDYGAWEETFTLFPRASGEECQLPERCGGFGLCEDSQCVACPSPNGLLGWSKRCSPPKLTSCKSKDIKYYKLEGVDHFISKYTRGNGPMKEEECSRKCTSDCKCLGFFFNRAQSRCWIVYDLMTLTKVDNSTHLGYIKAPIH
ncbi:epidermis-specific secreted glycoprotein ep1 [Phtheirospermum japonicum]|uniref:Epidermis-specific secreted glycoprotein ep1 n=1 Tax=Phtheirospermum japonicum TaxID=374723 RepID=A0A830AYM8_9LAMI|nr:epidermis-specific secreted glycoprotein ep1 [Phtheirospermum japonicum]